MAHLAINQVMASIQDRMATLSAVSMLRGCSRGVQRWAVWLEVTGRGAECRVHGAARRRGCAGKGKKKNRKKNRK